MTDPDDHASGAVSGPRSDRIDVVYVGDETAAAALADEHELLSVGSVETIDEMGERLSSSVDCVVSEVIRLGGGRTVDVAVRERRPEVPVVLYAGSRDDARWALERDIAVVSSDGAAGPVGLADRVVSEVHSRRKADATLPTEAYYTLTEAASDAIVTIDEEGVIRYANPAAGALFGYDRSDLIGRAVTALMDDETASEHRSAFDRYLERGERTVGWNRVELSGRDTDGSKLILDVSFGEYCYAGDRYFIGVLRDVSERREMEEALREREQQLSTLFADLPGMVYRARNEPDWPFEFVSEGSHELVGYTPDELTSGAVSWGEEILVPEDRERAWVETQSALEAGEQLSITYRVETNEGERRWLKEWGHGVYEDGELVALEGFVTDVTERKRWEQGLAVLNDAGRELLETRTHDAIAEIIVEAIEDAIGHNIAVTALYDDVGGGLDPRARTSTAVGLDADELLLSGSTDLGWQAFAGGDPVERSGLPDDTPLSSVLALPLGRHGVLVVGSTDDPSLATWKRDLVRLLVATARVAFDRVERDRAVREQERRLSEQNERLERLARVNAVIRGIDRVLVDATTRAEIEREVPERLVSVDPYAVAWVGTLDTATGEIQPREWAGGDAALVGTLADAPPVRNAVESGDATTFDVFDDPPLSEWREEALERGIRSGIAVPIAYDDTTYSVMAILADRPGAFDEIEREVIAELGSTIGHAINAIERKHALITDEVTELEFEIGDDVQFVRAARELDAEFEFLSVVPADDELHGFFAVTGAEPETVLTYLDEETAAGEVALISEDADRCTFEYATPGDGLLRTVLDNGGVPRAMRATAAGGRLVVELAADADIRRFVESLQTSYDGTELVARRQRDRPLKTPASLRGVLNDRLTDRQLEALEMAYFGGFFESPRKRTGSELGESLGITQPTFNQHLRAAERTVFELLFEGGRV